MFRNLNSYIDICKEDVSKVDSLVGLRFLFVEEIKFRSREIMDFD